MLYVWAVPRGTAGCRACGLLVSCLLVLSMACGLVRTGGLCPIALSVCQLAPAGEVRIAVHVNVGVDVGAD